MLVILPSFVNAKKAGVSYLPRRDPQTLLNVFSELFKLKVLRFILKSDIAAKTFSYFYFEGKFKTK